MFIPFDPIIPLLRIHTTDRTSCRPRLESSEAPYSHLCNSVEATFISIHREQLKNVGVALQENILQLLKMLMRIVKWENGYALLLHGKRRYENFIFLSYKNRYHLLSTYYVSETLLSSVCTFSHLLLPTAPKSRDYDSSILQMRTQKFQVVR